MTASRRSGGGGGGSAGNLAFTMSTSCVAKDASRPIAASSEISERGPAWRNMPICCVAVRNAKVRAPPSKVCLHALVPAPTMVAVVAALVSGILAPGWGVKSQLPASTVHLGVRHDVEANIHPGVAPPYS